MKRFSRLYTAVALGLGVTAAPYAFAQDAGLTRQQQVKQENDKKKEQKRENRDNEQLTKQERREAKREREQLNNMPKPVREALRSDTAQAGVKDVDYYRVEAEGGKGNAGREFGARFTAANGHKMDVRVDRDGKLLSRQDLTQAATASAQAPATAAQQPAPATPTTPTPATPAPGSATASTEAPESGNAIYRRLQATEVPANIRAIFDKDTTKASDVRYYRTKYGSQLAYEVKYTDASGKDMRHYVSDAGQTLVQGESKDDDNEKLASAADRRERDRDRDRDRNRDRDRDSSARRDDRDRDRDRDRDHRDDASTASGEIKTGRVELNDMPRSVQTQMRRLTEGGKDVKFYRAKYGSQGAYEAKYTDAKGKDQSIYLDDSGKVLKRSDDASGSGSSSSSSKK